MNNLTRQILPHLTAIGIFLVVAAMYFSPQLQGKVAEQSDVIQYKGMAQEVKAYYEETGERSLWTNSMFGGMPTYQINTVSAGNVLRQADYWFRLYIPRPIGRFLAAMIGFYILMICLNVNHWIAIIGGIAFAFTTNNFILFETGHITKLKAVSYFPLIAAGMLLAFRGKYIWGGLLFALGLGLNIYSNHVQMTYYLFLTFFIFGVAQLVATIQSKDWANFLKGTAAIVVGGLLAFGSAASNLWITYEYSRDTMRGEPILQSEGGETQSSSETEGLDWDYAMQWSNNTLDVFASFIPGVVGGGSQEIVPRDAAIVKDLRSKGAQLPASFRAPLYWGALPFTSGPIYFGAVTFFLFLMGVVLVKGPIKWWLALGTLLTFLLSMGKNLPAFNEFFFYYVPLYSKFRTPNSVLTITSFLMPALGFLALGQIVNGQYTKKEIWNAVLIAAGVAGAISLFFALLGPSFFDFNAIGDDRLAQAGYSLDAIREDRKSLMTGDAFRTLILTLLSGGLIWAYINEKLQVNYVLIGIGLLTIFDLWTVGRRYLDESNFVNERRYQANFEARPVDQQILQDKSLSYRVFDATVSTFQSSRASYHHKSLGGYHAAKLQRYQDIIERHLAQNNQRVMDMLNTKYIIFPGQNREPMVQQNPNALGNAWFVDTIRSVNTANEEIDALTNFNPARETVIHQEFREYVDGMQLQRNGSIELTDYAPNRLTYTSNTSSDQLAIFSEIWYGPDKGWQAYIDGQPVDHFRANYILRAMKIPAGSHKIEFVFDPQTYKTGALISGISSTAIVLGLLGFIGFWGYENRASLFAKPEPTPPKDNKGNTGKKKTAAKTQSKRKKKSKKG